MYSNQEVFFPSITICNANQMEFSFLRSANIENDTEKTNILIKEFIEGYQSKEFDQEEEDFIEKIKKQIGTGKFGDLSSQKCKNLFIEISFQGKTLTWNDIFLNKTHFRGPHLFQTDFGFCCSFTPQIDLKLIAYEQLVDALKDLKAEAKSGYKNGLHILLNAEQFNYGYIFEGGGSGFEIALHHPK